MVILSGLMLVLSFPPFPFSFLAYFAFVPLLLVMDHTPDRVYEDRLWGWFKTGIINIWRLLTLQIIWRFRGKNWLYKRQKISRYEQIFRYAYSTFLIWNLGCCYWMMLTALGVANASEAIEALTAGLLANILNPFLMAIPIYLFARLRSTSRSFLLSLSFIPFWIAFEWMHFHWELSWSWLTLGHSQTFYPDWIQYSEFTGTLGISAHILLINILLYQGIRAGVAKMKGLMIACVVSVMALIIAPFALNSFLLNPERAVFQPTSTLNVRLLQPNIDPYDKFGGMTAKQQVALFVELMEEPGLDTIDLAILPETAIPRAIWNHQLRSDALLQPLWAVLLKEDSLSLLTGLTEVQLLDPATDEIPNSARYGKNMGYYEVYNAAALLRNGVEPQTFQKGKLVPLVERTPYLEHLVFLKNFQIDLGGSFGNYGKPPSMHPLEVREGAEIASLVCYESEYGDYIRPLIQKGAGIITVVTNDGWWNFSNTQEKRGGSSGHIQHAHLSVLRAIETRREVARSANTGISLFVDNKGYIHQPTEYWISTYTDRTCNLYEEQTFYVRHGDYLGWISAILSLLVMSYVWGRRGTRNHRAKRSAS